MAVYRLIPSPHEAIWGGSELVRRGKKPLTEESESIAESWELSFVSGSEAKTEDGRTVAEAFPKETWGKGCRDFGAFPVLTKFIDAKDKLSVQVHPSDDYALANEGQYGKTEMWLIVDAKPGAGIYAGLKRRATPEEFAKAVEDGSVEGLLDFHEVKPGDVYFIPSGTIHAIGAGVLLYEIQQNSTLTYRLYDYMRRDKAGNLRPLHVEKAMKVAHLDLYSEGKEAFEKDGNGAEIIGKCKYFITKRRKITAKTELIASDESYLSITVLTGKCKIDGQDAGALDSFFAPAGAGKIGILPEGDVEIVTVETRGE